MRADHMITLSLPVQKLVYFRNGPIKSDHSKTMIVHVQNQILAHHSQANNCNITFRFHRVDLSLKRSFATILETETSATKNKKEREQSQLELHANSETGD